MNKLPIFLHIPKCGGSSVLQKTKNVFLNFVNNKKYTANSYEKFILRVHKESKVILSVFCYAKKSNLKNRISNRENKNTSFAYISLDDFFSVFSDLKLFSIIIHSGGFRLLNTKKFQKTLSSLNRDIFYYCSLREPLDREVSLYYYLKSPAGQKEPTAVFIKEKTFEGHIKTEMSDSWLIRMLSDVQNNEKLTKKHFTNACSFLETVLTFDIKELDSQFTNVMKMVYNIDYTEKKQIIANQRQPGFRKSLKLTDLDKISKKTFQEKKHWDILLYDRFVKRDI